MYKKWIASMTTCGLILSGLTGIYANATDGLSDEAPAVAFEVPAEYSADTTVYTPVIDSAVADTAAEVVASSEEVTPAEETVEEAVPSIEETPEEAPAAPAETPAPENTTSEETSSDEGTDEKKTEGAEHSDVIAPEESTEENKSAEEEVTSQETPETFIEIVSTPAPAPSYTPSYNTSNRPVQAPSARPNTQQPTARPATPNPSSMLNYRVYQTAEYDPFNPTTWRQGNAPYSNEYFAYSGTTFGDASCGIHTLATLFLKTGYAIEGFNAVDAYNWALSNGFGENMNGMPAYAWSSLEEKTGGYLENVGYYDESDGSNAHDWIRNEYAKGNFVVIGTNLGNVPHVIMLDYVDEAGNIMTLDSGAGYQNLNQQDGGHVRYAFSFKVVGIPSYNSPKLWAGESLASFKPIRDAKYQHFAQNRNNTQVAAANH